MSDRNPPYFLIRILRILRWDNAMALRNRQQLQTICADPLHPRNMIFCGLRLLKIGPAMPPTTTCDDCAFASVEGEETTSQHLTTTAKCRITIPPSSTLTWRQHSGPMWFPMHCINERSEERWVVPYESHSEEHYYASTIVARWTGVYPHRPIQSVDHSPPR